MAFSRGVLTGKAKEVYIGGRKEENVYLELDFKEGTINAYLPRLKHMHMTVRELFRTGKKIYLKDVEFYIPAGKLTSEILDKLYIKSYSLGSLSVEESVTLNALGLLSSYSDKDTVYGYEVIKFIPSSGKIKLKLGEKINITEIVLSNWSLSLLPSDYGKIREKFGIILRPAPSVNLITATLEKEVKDLENFARGLNLALSYLQGAPLYFFIILKNSEFEIYLSSKPKKSKTFPLVPTHDENFNHIDELIYKFLKYWNSLKKDEKSKLESIVSGIIFSKTGDAYVEIQVLTLLNIIQIILESELNKANLIKTFTITDYDAEFILKLKEKLFSGYNFLDACTKIFSEIKETNVKNSIIYKIKTLEGKLSDLEISLHLLYALIKILDLYILRKINYEGKYLDPLNEFKAIYVNKILAEDRDLLEELKNR